MFEAMLPSSAVFMSCIKTAHKLKFFKKSLFIFFQHSPRPSLSDTTRRSDQWQWTFHLCSPGSGGQVPQCRQLRLLPLLPQQSAFSVVTATLRHVGRDAVRSEPPTGGLQEQPLPKPAAERHSRSHHGVQPGSARQQVCRITSLLH